MKKKLDISLLAGLKDVAKELRNKPLSKEYYEAEAKLIAEREKEYERQTKSLKMSYEKLHTPFTI